MNGDGKDDFIVGADLADPGNKLNAGSAYVHSGADGTLLYQVDGASTADRFGNSVSMAGDVNGDGAGDFIVGAWFADPGNKTNAGSAYVYSGADGSLLYQKNGAVVSDNLGKAVSAAGDVNGDGKGDFIVGAHRADPGNRNLAGSAYVYSGADGSLLYQVDGVAAGDNFGISVSNAGDVNGDGKGDFIVGAHRADPGNRNLAGSAYVYSGADGSTLYQLDGAAAGDFLGVSVSKAGDVNGDGKGDFIVGATGTDPGNRSDAGSAYVHSGADGTVLWQVDGAAVGDQLGSSVSNAGDVNGDGKGDFIVGAPQASPGSRSVAGSAYVHSGADRSLLWQVDGAAAGDFLGVSVSNAGDVNGDGKGDFIVGATGTDPGNRNNAGSAYVHSGADGTVLHQVDGAAASDNFGTSVGAPGSIEEEGA